MKDTLYNVIVKGIITVCMIVCAYSMVSVNIKMNHYIKEYNNKFEQYNNMVQQYDTTTTYNKLVLYPQIKALGDSLR